MMLRGLSIRAKLTAAFAALLLVLALAGCSSTCASPASSPRRSTTGWRPVSTTWSRSLPVPKAGHRSSRGGCSRARRGSADPHPERQGGGLDAAAANRPCDRPRPGRPGDRRAPGRGPRRPRSRRPGADPGRAGDFGEDLRDRRRGLNRGSRRGPRRNRGRVRDRRSARPSVASGLGYLLASRSLAPVDHMRRKADEITLERSGERLPLPRAEDEIHRLGETLNRMLDRIEASLERQRVFVADEPRAAHAARRAAGRARARGPIPANAGGARAALRSAVEEVDRLSRLAEDLLVVARSDQGELPIKRERVDLDELLSRVGARFTRRASERGRDRRRRPRGPRSGRRHPAGRAGAREPDRQRAPVRGR